MSAAAASPLTSSEARLRDAEKRGECPFFSIPGNLNEPESEPLRAVSGLPARFAVDAAALEARYHELQREVHPDRFCCPPRPTPSGAHPCSWQRGVNEAYQILKSPLRRAVYILQLRGVDPEFRDEHRDAA